MEPVTFHLRKLLKWTWIFFCSSLMAWQGFRCTQEFFKRPVVTSASFERFTDRFLSEFTVCPRASHPTQSVKEGTLSKHGLDLNNYLHGREEAIWKSANSNLTNEDLQKEISYKVEDLVKRIKWSEVDDNGNYAKYYENIENIAHLWNDAIIFGTGACFKLDIKKVKKTPGQLSRFLIESPFPGGLELFLNKVDQVYDDSLRVRMSSNIVKPEYQATHSLISYFTVSLEVIRSISTSDQPCNRRQFDAEMVRVATKQMMEAGGCVVLWVDRTEGAPICDGGDERSKKAYKIYEKIFRNSGLYGRRDIPPPCEYFIPTVETEMVYTLKNSDNLTTTADFTFKPQVHNIV